MTSGSAFSATISGSELYLLSLIGNISTGDDVATGSDVSAGIGSPGVSNEISVGRTGSGETALTPF